MVAIDFSDGAMIALYPRENEARALAADGGQPPESLHVTLLYLGTAREALPLIELTQAVAGGVASKTEALAGTVGGVATFDDNGDGAPVVLLPDVPGLTELGTTLRDELARVGVESPSEHGFQPHLTITYGGDAEALADRIGQPLHFNTLCVVVGTDRFEYPLQSPPQAMLSADHPQAPLPSEAAMGLLETEAEIRGLAEQAGIEVEEEAPEARLAAAIAEAEEAPAESAAEMQIEQPTNASQLRWSGVLMIENKPTDDGRQFENVQWRDLPLSLMAMTETGVGGHQGAELAGRIDEIWRDGDRIMGSGVFDDSDFGREVARLVDERMLRGISVDLVIRSYELRPRDQSVEELDGPDLVDVLLGEDVPMLFVATDCSIGAATVCPFPAFADAEIALVASAPLTWRSTRQSAMTITKLEAPAEIASSEEAATAPVTASAAGLVPIFPPGEWFENPGLEEPTPLQVTEDGRVFGHAAVWDVCHIGFEDACVLAPRSPSGYRYFHLGEVRVYLGDGDECLALPCGQLTLGTGHANLRLSRSDAAAHYDDTGTVAAHVIAGEDEFGIWFAGALNPDLSEESVRTLRGAKISGDWRNVAGELELVAMLAVNVPGFPVPRVRVASVLPEPVGEALVAAGVADRRILDGMRDRAEYEHRGAEGGGETTDWIEPARLATRVELVPAGELVQGTLAEAALATLATAHTRTAEAVERVVKAGPGNEERASRELAVAQQAIDVLETFAAREQPRPGDIHVHVPEREVNVAAPNVTVEAAAPAEVRVDAPQIDVHVPEQAAPQVLVAAPEVRVEVEAPKARNIRVEEDADGTRRYISEED